MNETPPRRSNVALIVSLCVNLVLAGVIVMAVFRFTMHRQMFPPAGPMGPMAERVQVHQILAPRLLMRAAPAKADAIHNLIKNHRDRIDALRADSQGARREVLRLYEAPVFDKPAFDKALAHMQAADAALTTEVLNVASNAAALLSPEERKKAAEWQPHGRGFGRGFGGDWQHHGPPDDGAAPDHAAKGDRPQ